jgi:CelD/BcsL family acetyltransferase involved in cellulose biosynthesis
MDLAAAPHPLSLAGADPAIPAVALPGEGIHALSTAEAADPAFARAWSDLALAVAEPNPFFEPWFLLPGLAAFARPSGGAPKLMAHVADGTLTGLLPLRASRDYYGFPLPHASAWLHQNAFCGAPLIARGQEEAFWRALLDALDRGSRTSLFAHFPAIPEEGPILAALKAVCAQQGRALAVVETRSRAMLASDASAAAYQAHALSKKHRKELARQLRRLGELGEVRFERSRDGEGLAQWARDYLALEAAGWKGEAGTALGASAAGAGFFVSTIEGAGAAGRLERLTMRLDGRPIAMLATFLTPPGAYSFKTAYDEDLARYSPGMQVQLEYLRALDRGEPRWTDSCAAEGHPMIDRLWTERRTLVSCNVAIGGPLRRALVRPLMAWETRKRGGR